MEKYSRISTKEFINISKNMIKEYLDKHTFYFLGSTDNIWQVWYTKTIQNHKGIFAVPHHIFECTYNGDEDELYLDCYNLTHKEINKVIKINEDIHGSDK